MIHRLAIGGANEHSIPRTGPITLAELEYGVTCSGSKRAQNRAALDLLVQDIPAASFDTAAAGAYGPIRAATRDRNRDALDKLIAAHAVALDVVLVTNNETDFGGYAGLRIENCVATGTP